MAEQIDFEVTDDDKLWALLAYVFSPIIPVILLLMEDKKNRPFIKAHNVQALVWGLVVSIVSSILAVVLIGVCTGIIGWGFAIYWGIKAYQGEMVNIPVITDFVKNQGWA
ncbi:MAG: DUF4870 domain-containing protein [Anaerolineales bacterium]|nr:DUF4870 domain-containing protein [Anaerolineales bacterium]